MNKEQKQYAVQVIYKNQWLTTKQRFDTFEEAEKWAKWNYQRNPKYKIIEILTSL